MACIAEAAGNGAAGLFGGVRHLPASSGGGVLDSVAGSGGGILDSADGCAGAVADLVGGGVDCVLDGLPHQGRQLGQNVSQGVAAAFKVLLVLRRRAGGREGRPAVRRRSKRSGYALAAQPLGIRALGALAREQCSACMRGCWRHSSSLPAAALQQSCPATTRHGRERCRSAASATQLLAAWDPAPTWTAVVRSCTQSVVSVSACSVQEPTAWALSMAAVRHCLVFSMASLQAVEGGEEGQGNTRA